MKLSALASSLIAGGGLALMVGSFSTRLYYTPTRSQYRTAEEFEKAGETYEPYGLLTIVGGLAGALVMVYGLTERIRAEERLGDEDKNQGS